MANFGVIYKVTNLITDKCYIGQTTKTLNERKIGHIKSHKSDNSYFHKAIRKYGEDNFIWEILCECSSKDELNEKEKYYIKLYNTKAPNGYNLTDGGNGSFGRIITEESRQKNSDSNKGKHAGELNPMYGKKHTVDALKKMSICNTGKNNPNYGKRSDKNKLSKKYIIIHPDGREEIIIGLRDFCINNNLNYVCMCDLANGRNKTHKGYRCIKWSNKWQ